MSETASTFERDAVFDDRMANPPRLSPADRKAYARLDQELSRDLKARPLQVALRELKKIYAAEAQKIRAA